MPRQPRQGAKRARARGARKGSHRRGRWRRCNRRRRIRLRDCNTPARQGNPPVRGGDKERQTSPIVLRGGRDNPIGAGGRDEVQVSEES
eukprot:5019163-Prorocentrum_lima.AAC.1